MMAYIIVCLKKIRGKIINLEKKITLSKKKRAHQSIYKNHDIRKKQMRLLG